jgi:hypothetical protein
MTGTVIDKTTNEPIFNVQVYSSDAKGKISNPPVGTITDFDGKYSLYPATSHITFKHIGYNTQTITLPVGTNTVNASLTPANYQLPVVEITYDNRNWWQKNQHILGLGLGISVLTTFLYYLKANK